MPKHPSLRPLYAYPDWVIHNIKPYSEMASIYLRRDLRYRLKCPYCHQRAGENRRKEQTVLDIPLGIANPTFINYEAIQGYYTTCQCPFTVLPPGIGRNAKATRRLMHYVCRLYRFMTTDKIQEFLPISTSTAR